MSGFENITANNGVGITLTGMTIVFIALVLISGYIALLPKILKKVSRFFPEEELPVDRSEDPDFAEELRMAVVVATALKKRRDIIQQLAASGEGL